MGDCSSRRRLGYASRMRDTDPYQQIARFYDRLIEPIQAGVRRTSVELVSPRPGWQVLDVGCGTGTGMAPYVEAGCAVTGVDVSAAMLEQAASRMGDRAELIHTDGDGLPFGDDRFDLVTTSMVLHEVPADKRVPFVAEMARVTKPAGRLLFIDFRIGPLRGWRGPAARAISVVMERLSGHYSHYRTFRMSDGVPGVTGGVGLDIEREKIVAGGNVAIFVVASPP